ncbi:MAG: hypothetical protein PHW18_06210 [Sulfuricurvum sp.]|uniref:hypothetical protein n=1 Tax=Sulfuricurvum sp. TaxID=2025608 RepID=UPI0026324B9B|nr:hypothetical protein [Sulfuricurvum sp.]MDD2829149.1 hypothetical protein [Sulfuricurvum sp.]MDD4950198.1 hypothetical protein [Sulfuricurvum sp.]
MIFTSEQLQNIKASTEMYRSEVNRINDLINTQQSEDRLDKLYLLRTIATIEHGKRVGLFDENNTDEFLEALGNEVTKHFPDKDDEELFDDLAILDDDLHNRLFSSTEKEKNILLKGLGITL